MIYKIKNPYGPAFYVFTEENTQIPQGVDAIFGTIETAEQKLQEVKEAFLQQEDYRFPIARVVVNGNDTTWSSVDENSLDEDGIFYVFNHNTGQYEAAETLQLCLSRRNELKSEFVNEAGLDQLEIVQEFTSSNVKTTTGTQTL